MGLKHFLLPAKPSCEPFFKNSMHRTNFPGKNDEQDTMHKVLA